MEANKILGADVLDIIFDGKNKEYGAYQLRKEDGATTTKAFFTALVFVTTLVALPILLSSFGEKPVVKPIELDDDPLIIREFTLPPKEEPKTQPRVKTESQPPVTTETLVDPHIVDAAVAPDTDFTKPEDVGKPNTENTNTNGNIGGTGTTVTATTTTTEEPEDNGTTIVTTSMVEKKILISLEEFQSF